MSTGNGHAALAVGAGAVFAVPLALVLLAAAVFGGSSAQGSTTGTAAAVSGALNTAKIPAADVPLIYQAAGTCSVLSAPLLAAQFYQESGFNPDAVSDTGAMGITQFEPGTWSTWASPNDGDGKENPYNPADEIPAAARYDCALAQQVSKVPGNTVDNMLAAYNAGPGAVLAAGGVPDFAQTQQYVQNIDALIPTFTLAASTASAAASSGGVDTFAQAEIAAAAKYIGSPYVYGGGTPAGPSTGGSGDLAGFDCSGLVLYAVYQASGGAITLPHLADDQAHLGQAVAPADMEPGDVIAMKLDGTAASDPYSHIVIYVGGGMVISAPKPGEDIRVQSLAGFGNVPMAIRRFG